ncbi:MAG: carboxypeptidase-like regulatory domain-containing protein [Reichenbachiella sp.]
MLRASIILTFFIAALSQQLLGQNSSSVLQFTGIVVNEEDEYGVPGVHIYTMKGGRGTTTNVYGYYSMPVLPGDTLIVSAVSFEKEQIFIPPNRTEDLTVIIRLKPDITYLEEVEVSPFPSEELFKEAILALRLPNHNDIRNMQQNVDQEMLNKIYRGSALGASGNHHQYMSQQSTAYNNRFQTNSISLMNPFAWSQFIKSLKKSKQE